MRATGALLVLLGVAAVPAAAQDEPAAAVDRWVVVLADPRPPRRQGWAAGAGYAGNQRYDQDPQLRRLADAMARDHDIVVLDQWPIRSLSVHCVVVELGGDSGDVLRELRADDRVRWVQPLNEFEGGATASFEDPYRKLQGSLDRMNIGSVHSRVTGRGVRVAVIDSGVEFDHPDLAHAFAERRNFVANADHSPERHGTGIAGVLVAASGNGEGISGVAPSAKLYAYRACWEADGGTTRCNSLTLSRALDRAVEVRPHVVKLSLTGPKDRLLEALLDRILANGAFVVAAFDDRRQPQQRFPSLRSGVLVARTGVAGQSLSDGAVAAPGDAILTTQPGHGYDFMTGHSLAAAHVSGVLALMLQANPELEQTRALELLLDSVRQVGQDSSIDACRAVQSIQMTVTCGTVSWTVPRALDNRF